MENDNPKGISEIERVKWLISRIDLYHKITLDNIESGRKIFTNGEEKALNRVKSWKRGIFSILGIIVSTMFGFNSFQPLDEWIIYAVLASVSIAGVINYIFFNFVESIVDNSFALFFQITNESNNYISESQLFVASQFADLGFLEIKSIKNYGIFTLLLSIAISVHTMNEVKKQKSIKTLWIISLLKDNLKEIEKSTEIVPKLYDGFDNSQLFPQNCYDLIEKTLKKYKPKSDKQTIKN